MPPTTANFLQDATLGIDQECQRNGIGAQHVLQHQLPVDVMRECRSGLGEKSLGALPVIVDRYTDHVEPVAVALKQPLQRSHFGQARATVTRPDVDDQGLAEILRQKA